MLVRLRLIGGHVLATRLRALADVARQYGDGRVYLTTRANLQVRALPGRDGRLDADALAALEATGLIPRPTHELVRNVMMSPQTGLAGGRADLRRVGRDLDALLCDDPRLSALPGRFLFVLDDGRGDLIGRTCDLGAVALDGETAQLRVGAGWGRRVALADAAAALADLAGRFVDARGAGPGAAWHVSELAGPLTELQDPDPSLPEPAPALAFGDVPGGRHVRVPESGLDADAVAALTERSESLIVTPWRGVLIPEEH